MQVTLDTSEILNKHAEAIAFARAKTIDGYVQLYVRKRPALLPKKLYRFILKKLLVLAFFKEN